MSATSLQGRSSRTSHALTGSIVTAKHPKQALVTQPGMQPQRAGAAHSSTSIGSPCLHDAAAIQAADGEAVEGGGHQAAPAPDDVRVHEQALRAAGAERGLCDAPQQEAVVEEGVGDGQQAFLQAPGTTTPQP